MKERVVWALKNTDGSGMFLGSGDCCIAPKVFESRREARREAALPSGNGWDGMQGMRVQWKEKNRHVYSD
jgi:hypothetical protein